MSGEAEEREVGGERVQHKDCWVPRAKAAYGPCVVTIRRNVEGRDFVRVNSEKRDVVREWSLSLVLGLTRVGSDL